MLGDTFARRHLALPLLAPVVALLAACGDGGVNPEGDPPGPDPDESEGIVLDDDEVRALEETGDVFPAEPVDVAAERARRAREVEDARARVDAYLAEHPEASRWLDPAEPVSPDRVVLPSGDVAWTLPTGRVVRLQGDDVELLSNAAAIEAMARPGYHEGFLDLLTRLVPTICREWIPPREDWDALGPDALADAIGDVGRCYEEWRSFVGPIDDAVARTAQYDLAETPTNTGMCTRAPYTESPGGGRDQDASCTPTSDLVTGYVHAADLPPTTDQAGRGTCVAFSTVSGMEYALRRKSDITLDLSEQYLYSLGAWDWERRSYGDGLNTVGFLEWMASERKRVPVEEVWGYNPSPCRIEDDARERYLDTCVHYSPAQCSDTAHQLGAARDGNGNRLLRRPRNDADAPTAFVVNTRTFGLFDPALRDAYTTQMLADAGWALIASMSLTADFMNAGRDGWLPSADDSKTGDHAMHVVRVVPDATAPGGAWIVFKNSWGCNWGDAGYAYVSRRWFLDHAKTVVAFEARREIGEDLPPEVEIVGPNGGGPLVVETARNAGNRFTLEATSSDREQDACCDVHWYSDLDGYLGQGDRLSVVLEGAGRRVVRAVVRDQGGQIAEDFLRVWLENDAPEPFIDAPTWEPRPGESLTQRVPVGQNVLFAAGARDTGGALPCSAFAWDVYRRRERIGGSPICVMPFTFDAPGEHVLRVETVDPSGEVGIERRIVRAVSWGPERRPFVSMLAPRRSDVRIDPLEPTRLTATSTSHETVPAEVRWYVEGRADAIATGTSVELRFQSVLPGACGERPFTLRVEASNANGTDEETIDLIADWPIC